MIVIIIFMDDDYMSNVNMLLYVKNNMCEKVNENDMIIKSMFAF
jgi:hypothetical protein